MDIRTATADGPVSSPDATAGRLDCTAERLAEHNPALVAAAGDDDETLCFLAFISHFDGPDDDDGDGVGDLLRVPHWVAQRVRPSQKLTESRSRPSRWFTVPTLNKLGIAPTDDSYRYSRAFRQAHPDWYDRGHLAQKYLTERVGADGGWYSHNVVNAVPQRSRFNSNPWLELECLTGAWANRYGIGEGIWIITGPVFVRAAPRRWLAEPGRPNALPVAIPDYLFKVVIRPAGDQLDWLAFIYPQEDPSYLERGPWNPQKWSTTIAQVEELTGLRFFEGEWPVSESEALRLAKARRRASDPELQPGLLWWSDPADFDPGCRRFAR